MGLPTLAVALSRHAPSSAAPLEIDGLGRRVLVVVPHPDDEVLLCGGTINRLIRSGARVKIVLLTSGDGYLRAARRLAEGKLRHGSFRALGETRFEESRDAAIALGLDPVDLVCLGYPDGQLYPLWDERWDPSHVPPCWTTGSACVPYSWAYRPGAPYRGVELAADLTAIIEDFEPDTVIGPAADDQHDDHSAGSHLLTYVLALAGFRGVRLDGIVHFGGYPLSAPSLRERPAGPPAGLVDEDTTWHSVRLDPEAMTAKAAAIERHASQIGLKDMRMFMSLFVRTHELFASRRSSSAAMTGIDSTPSAMAGGSVITVHRTMPPRAGTQALRSVRVLRGPQRLWIGLQTGSPLDRHATCRIGIRPLDGGTRAERLDIVVTGSRAGCSGTSSVEPCDLLVERDGATLWVGVPAAAVSDCERCMVGAAVISGSGGDVYWRDVSLAGDRSPEPAGDVRLGPLVDGVGKHGPCVADLDETGGAVHRLA